jgi:hypothetical protein
MSPKIASVPNSTPYSVLARSEGRTAQTVTRTPTGRQLSAGSNLAQAA